MLQPKGLLLVQSLNFIERDTRAKTACRRSQGPVNGLQKRRPQNGPTLNCTPLPIFSSCSLSYSVTVPMISAYHVALNSMRMLPNAGTQNHLTDSQGDGNSFRPASSAQDPEVSAMATIGASRIGGK